MVCTSCLLFACVSDHVIWWAFAHPQHHYLRIQRILCIPSLGVDAHTTVPAQQPSPFAVHAAAVPVWCGLLQERARGHLGGYANQRDQQRGVLAWQIDGSEWCWGKEVTAQECGGMG